MLRRRGGTVLPRVFLVAAALVGATFVAPTSAVLADDEAKTSSAADKPVEGPLSELTEKFEVEKYDAVDTTLKIAKPAEFTKLKAKAEKSGKVQVIAGLRMSHTAEGALSSAAADSQRAMIGLRTSQIRAAVAGDGARVVTTFEFSPYVALELSSAALDRLQESGLAASVQENELDQLNLNESTVRVEANESWKMGRAGAGQNVAILDTGIQKNHPFLRFANGKSKVISEGCYSLVRACPGGTTLTTKPGVGAPCSGTTQCHHGTHVGGIAAGRGKDMSGVARDAGLISLRVFSVFYDNSTCGGNAPCALSYTSDQIKALERVYGLSKTKKIASANMSLGSFNTYSRPCDTDPRKRIIDTLKSKRIATVISSGNSSSNTGVGAPGCISSAVTVGATNGGTVASFSNSNSHVDLLAPGVAILSSIPGSKYASFDGTSMAAPHVAGAFAILKGIRPGAAVSTIEGVLKATGAGVKDKDNGVLKRRIRVLSAGVRLADTGLRVAANYSAPQLDMTSDGVGLARRDGGPSSTSFKISGIPAGASVYLAKLVYTTIGGPDSTVTFNGKVTKGALVGVSKPTCTNLNTGQPNRTYLANVRVTKNGTYPISGVGAGKTDGQGASLIVLFRKPTGLKGRVTLRVGASSALPNNGTASAQLYTYGNGSHFRPPGLHFGVGDATSWKQEYPMKFNRGTVTPGNYFTTSAGRDWDDRRRNISKSLVPAGKGNRPLTLQTKNDCMVLSYAAISWFTSG